MICKIQEMTCKVQEVTCKVQKMTCKVHIQIKKDRIYFFLSKTDQFLRTAIYYLNKSCHMKGLTRAPLHFWIIKTP